VESAFGLKHKLEFPFQVHIPEDLIQGLVAILPRAPFWPASIKVMQRTFNP